MLTVLIQFKIFCDIFNVAQSNYGKSLGCKFNESCPLETVNRWRKILDIIWSFSGKDETVDKWKRWMNQVKRMILLENFLSHFEWSKTTNILKFHSLHVCTPLVITDDGLLLDSVVSQVYTLDSILLIF